MLKAEDNALLTQTGPGTRMGELLRRYWIPVALSEELPYPGCPPVRVKILGESLIALRTADGRYGLLQEQCAHRRASLYFGRNEGRNSRDGQCGIRCAYHAWKYDIDGQCIDMPSEPAHSKFKQHIRLTAYPATLRGDVVWAYMGPAGTEPELPELEWAMVPEDQRFVSKRCQFSNYMQAMEGGIDSSHVSFLHSDLHLWNPSWNDDRDVAMIDNVYTDTAPRFFIEQTDYGMLIGARREMDDDHYYWRVTQWLMPWYTIIPRDGDGPIGGHAWVPIDDQTCWAWSINYHPDRPFKKRETDFYRAGGGIHAKVAEPNSYFPMQTAENDYLINRTLQRTVSFSGIEGIAMQDVAMQESMGPIVDRTKERLVPADSGIIKARQKLRKAAIALRDEGVTPPGVDPAHHRVRSAAVVLPQAESFLDSCRDAVKVTPGVRQASV